MSHLLNILYLFAPMKNYISFIDVPYTLIIFRQCSHMLKYRLHSRLCSPPDSLFQKVYIYICKCIRDIRALEYVNMGTGNDLPLCMPFVRLKTWSTGHVFSTTLFLTNARNTREWLPWIFQVCVLLLKEHIVPPSAFCSRGYR